MKTITMSIMKKRTSFSIRKSTSKVSIHKQQSGIVPNLIHSMDSATISILVDNLLLNFNNVNLVTIHDCFVTDANHADFINFQVKAAFASLYKDQKFIDKFHTFFLNYLVNLGYNIDFEKNILILQDEIYQIPVKPVFTSEEHVTNNILSSTYFLI
jgi:DNA-directed RNA polymerase